VVPDVTFPSMMWAVPALTLESTDTVYSTRTVSPWLSPWSVTTTPVGSAFDRNGFTAFPLTVTLSIETLSVPSPPSFSLTVACQDELPLDSLPRATGPARRRLGRANE